MRSDRVHPAAPTTTRRTNAAKYQLHFLLCEGNKLSLLWRALYNCYTIVAVLQMHLFVPLHLDNIGAVYNRLSSMQDSIAALRMGI